MNLSSDLCSKSGWPWRGFNRWTFLYYKHETNLNIKRVHFEEHVFFIFFIIDICTIAHLQCIGQVHAYLYKEYFYFLAIVWSCHFIWNMIWAVCIWTSVPQGNRKLILRWSLTCTWESLTLDGPLMASPALSTATRKDQTRTTVCYQQLAFHNKYLVSQICKRIFSVI